MKQSFTFVLLLYITVTPLLGQVFPVRTITNVSAPYPVSLEQFAEIGNEHISLTIIPNDIKLQNYPVKLRLVISGGWFKIYTNPDFKHKDIILNNGETQIFSGSELINWFNPDNLIFEGLSKAQYLKTGRLPEGVYQIWFETYDYFQNNNISGPVKAMIVMFENEAPYLNFPENAKEIPAIDPQNIIFNWTQRQAPFSSAGASNEYKFEVWEVWPDDLNVEDVVRSTQPLYSTSINTTTFPYTADAPILIAGRKYAWRVHVYDPEGRNKFKNDGFSEVRWFRFGTQCGVPNLLLDKTTPSAIGIKWEGDYHFSKYELRYRNKGKSNANWYMQDATGLTASIDKLNPNTEYEIQLHGYCGEQEGNYSPTLTVRTKQETTFACGSTPTTSDQSNLDPLPALLPGDYIHAADFEVKVYKATGTNGTFTGQGYALVPLLKFLRFMVDFKNIKVNTDYRMTKGEINFIYDETNGLVVNIDSLINSLNKPKPILETNPYADVADIKAGTDTTIIGVTVNASGDITTETADGHHEVIHATKGEMVAITGPSDGSEQYVVDTQNGTLYKGSPEKSSETVNSETRLPQATDKPVKYAVTFTPHNQQIYGLDVYDPKAPLGNYDKTTIGGKDYIIPWKSVEKGKIDRLKAEISGGNPDSLNFLTESGNLVMTAPDNGSGVQKVSGSPLNSGTSKQILVTGIEESDKLKAWYSETEHINDSVTKENRILAGQVNIAAYDKLTYDLCIVEVNGAAVPDALPVEKVLNEIYGSSVVQWKVTRVKKFHAEIPHLKNGMFDDEHPGTMKYNDCENDVIDAFENDSNYNKNTVYLFFIGGETTNQAIKGYMSFNRQFGFIYRDNQDLNELIRTMAHELGHGAFRLKHVFEPDCQFPQPAGQTENLMDYVGPENATTALLLHKYQWDEERTWRLGINWFEDGSEAEMNSLKYYDELTQMILHKIRNRFGTQRKLEIYCPNGQITVENFNLNGKTIKKIIITTNSNGFLYDVDINKFESDFNTDLGDKSLTGFKFDDKFSVMISTADYYTLKSYLFDKTTKDYFVPKFSKISESGIDIDILNKISAPATIDQNNTPLCGMACIANILASSDADGYCNLVKDLFYYGSACYGSNHYWISPSNNFASNVWDIGPIDATYPSQNGQKMTPADYVLLTSLRSSENGFLPYSGSQGGSGAQGLAGFTLPGTMMTLITKMLGINDVDDKTKLTSSGGDFKTLQQIDLFYQQGYDVFLFINSDMCNVPKGSTIKPNHWVIYRGGLTIDPLTNKAHFQVFHHGFWVNSQNYPIDINEQFFKDDFYGYIKARKYVP